MSDIYTEYTRIKHELAAAQAECAKIREENERICLDIDTQCDINHDRLQENERLRQERETISAAVNALLAEIESVRDYSPVYVVVQADKQPFDIIRAQDYDETHAMIRKAAAAVRAAIGEVKK